MIVVRMTRLEKLVAASFIFMLLIVTIVPIYGLSEEEAEEFYQKFKEAIEYLDFTLPGETEKTISEQTAESINTKIRTTALELISTPEFIEEFKSVYNKTNGFTENLEAWGALFKEVVNKQVDRIIEMTEIPESRELHQKLKEELSSRTNEELAFPFWEFEPKTGAEVMAELEAIETKVKEEFDPKRMLNMTEAERKAEAIAAKVKGEFKEKMMTNNTEVGTASGASTLEEQLKLAQKKLEEAGVHGEYGVSREVPETKTEIEIDYKEVHKEIAELKILLKEIENKIYLLELELLS